ncbi:hypothetical protein [Endozoicomonas numazuensis]|uniref:Uncharacterized protein n=1 Tax=Endozoicomonas numazuensis TaxID=1137799 RepID=A0A081NH08_9GAMM|nr:hypothetical protein [Endozoicomonas numazuensis]KEQ17731.1 hypothetical protein GZ78_08590 [Endozoicomonas numazuensis]
MQIPTFVQQAIDAYNTGHYREAITTLMTVGLFNNRNVTRSSDQTEFAGHLRSNPVKKGVEGKSINDRLIQFVETKGMDMGRAERFIFAENKIRQFSFQETLSTVTCNVEAREKAEKMQTLMDVIGAKTLDEYQGLLEQRDNLQNDLARTSRALDGSQKSAYFEGRTNCRELRSYYNRVDAEFSRVCNAIDRMERDYPGIAGLLASQRK